MTSHIGDNPDMELIGVRVIRPYQKNKRCYALQYSCDVADCPLLAKNQCINVGMFDRCVYGRVNRVNGWTPRAKKYSSFLKKWQQKVKDNPISEPKGKKVTFIGDYVWLPYSFMNHLDGKKQGIIFGRYSGAFLTGGVGFMLREHFTPEMIVKLVEFRPQALFGGTITSYFDEIVPRFLNDLRETALTLFNDALMLKPEIEGIALMARPVPVSLGWLRKIDWTGKASIDKQDCFIHTTRIRFNLNSIDRFPNSIGEIEVMVELPPETLVYPDSTKYRYMQLMNRARKEGAIVDGKNG